VTMRLFLAVDPAEEVRKALGRAIARIRHRAPDAKWMSAKGIHLTLKFLGEVHGDIQSGAVGEAVRAVTARHAAFTLHAAGGGTFGNGDRPNVLWGGVRGDVAALGALQRDVERAVKPLGFDPEDRTFTPHLTLALARGPHGDPALAACAPLLYSTDFGESRITEVVLYRSVFSFLGERFVPLERHAFGGAGVPAC
jgi:2'-5' RNA ligase